MVGFDLVLSIQRKNWVLFTYDNYDPFPSFNLFGHASMDYIKVWVEFRFPKAWLICTDNRYSSLLNSQTVL